MNRLLNLGFFALLTGSARAEAFTRPIPQAQSATAEFWFLAASIALLLALMLVYYLVHRR